MSLGYLALVIASASGGSISGLEFLLTGIVAVGVAIYLAVALLRPDKF